MTFRKHLFPGFESPCKNSTLECQNGGTCDLTQGIPRCFCKEGYFGERCQLQGGTSFTLSSIINILLWFKNITSTWCRINKYHFHFILVSNSSTCLKNQFTCSNNKCVPYAQACDGINDCGDNSDEILTCHGMSRFFSEN